MRTSGFKADRTKAGRTVLVFAPHPDDEVIACGGTILKRVDADCDVHICFATDGSQSHRAVLGLDNPSPDQLIEIRKMEALEAAAVLGVPACNVTFAGAPDTRLIEAIDSLRAAIDSLLASLPQIAEVFLPHCKRELNADHRLTGQIAVERLAVAGLMPQLFKYVVWDADVEAGFGYRNRLVDAADAETADERLVQIDISLQLERKVIALMKHATQTTLYAPNQDRAVVPPILLDRVRSRHFEDFWVPGGHIER